MTGDTSVRLNITLPPQLVRQLDETAKRTYNSRSGVIRLALLAWLDRHAPATPQSPSSASEQLQGPAADDNPARTSMLRKLKQPIPRNGEVAYHTLIQPDMTGPELLELMFEFEKYN